MTSLCGSLISFECRFSVDDWKFIHELPTWPTFAGLVRGRAEASDKGGLDLELPLLASDPYEPLDDIESVGV